MKQNEHTKLYTGNEGVSGSSESDSDVTYAKAVIDSWQSEILIASNPYGQTLTVKDIDELPLVSVLRQEGTDNVYNVVIHLYLPSKSTIINPNHNDHLDDVKPVDTDASIIPARLIDITYIPGDPILWLNNTLYDLWSVKLSYHLLQNTGVPAEGIRVRIVRGGRPGGDSVRGTVTTIEKT